MYYKTLEKGEKDNNVFFLHFLPLKKKIPKNIYEQYQFFRQFSFFYRLVVVVTDRQAPPPHFPER